MRVFVAGGSGAMGWRLVPQLVAGGHQVVAMTRDKDKAARLLAVGAQPAITDALDRTAVLRAVTRAQPDVLIHQLTGLVGLKNVKNFDSGFSLTNRLRTEGTDHLLEGALEAGTRRFIAQKLCRLELRPHRLCAQDRAGRAGPDATAPAEPVACGYPLARECGPHHRRH